jgi:hypothetical protein
MFMTSDAKKLLVAALSLPQEARAALAASLIESLDSQVDEDAESAWESEIAQRVQEVRDGTVDLVPWCEARRRILGQ